MASPKSSRSDLYEYDYFGWICDQVRALRRRRIEEIDFENVAEEIEDLGKSEKRSLHSHLETLIVPLLKLTYAGGLLRIRNARSWENTVELARSRIRRLLDESPSLRPALHELFNHAYKDARIDARRGLGFPSQPLPETPPWTLEQVLN